VLADYDLLYDLAGRIIRFDFDSLAGDDGQADYDCDALGRRIALTDPEENTTTWGYDNLGRAIAETNQLDDTRYLSYDATGRRTSPILRAQSGRLGARQ
jgi:YD repeat-containing protein